MSLYSGITFGSSVAHSGSGSKDDAISVDAAASGNAGDAANKAAAQADADKYAAEQAANVAREQQESNRKAALGFQPVVRKRPATGSAALKPRMVTSTMAAVASGPSVSSTANVSSSVSPLAAMATTPATQSAEPAPASTSAPATTTGGTSMVGRTLIVAPSMTLADEDVNGFASSAAGKKAQAQANKRAGGNKKNKAKRRGGAGAEEDPSLAWTAEYDPARPTDYTMYKEYTKLLRAQKREAAREERRLKEREQRLREAYGESGSGSGSSGSDDDDGDDSDEERRRRIDAAEKRFKGFVPPPVSYDAPVQSYPYGNDDDAVPDDTDEEDAPQGMQGVQAASASAAPAPAPNNEADEWASWSGAAPAGAVVVDDPYARRMAMSIQNQSGQTPQQAQPIQPQSYASAPQPPPAFPHPSAFGAPPMSLPLPGGQSIPLPPSFQARPTSASPLPGTSPMGAVQPPQPPQTSAAGGLSIEEAQARARAIAARLAAMKGGVSPAGAASPYIAPPASSYDGIPGIDPPQPPAPQAALGGRPSPSAGIASQGNPEDFAKNLMNKYGWTKGQGLGATSQGMLNPLALSTDPAAAAAGASKKKKQQQAQQQQQQQQAAQAKVTGMASAKGRVTSDLKTEKERAEREKFGEPTRIVCLSNMVGRDEVDEELINDVSEEAGKLGILERCFVHVMPEYAAEEDAVRVFIVYSGLVGAWKAAKAFEGRHFGGRQVRARFYDETAFATRTLHL